MVDYKKLKIAHELAERLFNVFSLQINILTGTLRMESGTLKHSYCLDKCEFTEIIKFPNIEYLLSKLTELTRLEPTYKVGSIVWILWQDEILETNIDSICGSKYFLNKITSLIYESQIYPTKKSLIEAQLDYWKELLCEELVQQISSYCEPIKNHLEGNFEKVECQHESDGKIYHQCENGRTWQCAPNHSKYAVNKCKKCGEFYK